MHQEDSVTDIVNTRQMVKEVSGMWGAEYHKSNLDHPSEDDLDFGFSGILNFTFLIGPG